MFTNSTQRHGLYHRETDAWGMIHMGSITSKRYSAFGDREDRWEITYRVPESVHNNLEEFREGLRNRIAQALTGNQNNNSGISISNPEPGADGKYTVTATLTGNAFHQMNIIDNEAEKATNQHSR